MIVQESLVSLAASSVEKMILTGVLTPGQRITEPGLAEQLGISRPPLREALRVLAGHGLLEQVPRRGYRVIDPSDEDLDEIFTLRHALESFAFDLVAAPGAGVADLGPVDGALGRMHDAARGGDAAEFAAANRAFHLEMVRAAGHSRLTDTYERLLTQMQIGMARDIQGEAETRGELTSAYERHAALLEALRTGDRERIRVAHHAHGSRPVTCSQLTA
ncbi:GntR family transcriptional regulator [Rhodococcus rhodnii]|nr:GntR family transcriptional regulator [Rhodococcus rhodnii]TXG88999.1 GntR family transcriptional regulator [Rhodococcus rhodnii]